MSVAALIDRIVVTSVAEQYLRPWSVREHEFLRRNLQRLGYAEVARQLGRSTDAVKIRQVRQGLPAPSKYPGWYTGNQVARLLGVDIHAVMMWRDRGILKFYVIPGQKGILQIKRVSLWVWAINPENWIFFRPERVRHPQLRKLIELRRQRWGDEWWRPGQVADYWGLKSCAAVNRRIREGKLPAKRWGNWWIKRSDALAKPIYPGPGGATGKNTWSPRADEFILRSRQTGLQFVQIARLMGWDVKKVTYRYKMLVEKG